MMVSRWSRGGCVGVALVKRWLWRCRVGQEVVVVVSRWSRGGCGGVALNAIRIQWMLSSREGSDGIIGCKV